MKRQAANLLVGVAVGAVGLWLLQRLQAALREEDIEALRERLGDQLSNLEDRMFAPNASALVN